MQKANILNHLTDITQFSENFETARDDREKLSSARATLSTVVCNDMAGDDIIAAISSYKKSKGHTTTDHKKVFDQRNSFQGKNVTAVDMTGHTLKVRMHVASQFRNSLCLFVFGHVNTLFISQAI